MTVESKVIAATNRIDILDPALLRSGRLDRKIEFPLPNETARARILEIHSRKMAVSSDVNYEELARSTDEFNGAQLKAVCVEAGMIALREGASKLSHEHFLGGIAEGTSAALGQPCPVLMTLCPDSPEQEEERPGLFHVVPPSADLSRYGRNTFTVSYLDIYCYINRSGSVGCGLVIWLLSVLKLELAD